MKKISLVILVLASFNGITQFKNDKWLLGFYPILLSFENGDVKDSLIVGANFYNSWGGSNINDSHDVLFYCNGVHIYNKNGQMMENGDYILPNKLVDYMGGYGRVIQQTIILPKKDNQFYVFSWGISNILFDSISQNQTNGRWDILTYSIVDLSYNNGLGKVISKENYLLQNEDLSACQMSAVRHANGRDWWLVKPDGKKHSFFTFLITPENIIQQPIQEFATPAMLNGVNGQSNFSVDGSLYVLTSEVNPDHCTQINTFDRCTGKMEKYKTIYHSYDTINQWWNDRGTACFSPDNKYVYLINNVSIVQHNLITDEQVEIVTGTKNPCGDYTSHNAPDGRIYLGNFHGLCNSISYIKYPNNYGISAEYCENCYTTSNINTNSPPNMPNYELGALLGSPCDTIKPPVAPELSWQPVLPNAFTPNGDGLNDHWHLLNTADMQTKGYRFKEVSVFNRWGNNVFKSNDVNFVWSGKGWASGSYFYYVRFVTSKGDIKLSKGNVQVIR